MTANDAMGEARAIAGASWTENDVKRVALALMRVEGLAREKALREVMDDMNELVRTLGCKAEVAKWR